MRKHNVILGGVIAACLASGAWAQTSVDRSFKEAPKDCADVQWSQAALSAYPKIASACQDVEQRNGKTYVKFEGTVKEVADNGRVTVAFKEGDVLTLAPPRSTVLYVDGKRTPIAELQSGMSLNFYVPEDQLQAQFFSDNTSQPVSVPFVLQTQETIVPREQSVAASAAEDAAQNRSASNRLPATASELPLLAMSGAVFMLLGAGMTLGRKIRG